MTKEQKIDMFAMRLDGATLQEIGDKYGITRERVRQLMVGKDYCPNRSAKKCVYKGLQNWIIENKSNAAQIAVKADLSPCTIGRLLDGHNSTKSVIDAILSVTGLTYEEAFGERVEESDNA